MMDKKNSFFLPVVGPIEKPSLFAFANFFSCVDNSFLLFKRKNDAAKTRDGNVIMVINFIILFAGLYSFCVRIPVTRHGLLNGNTAIFSDISKAIAKLIIKIPNNQKGLIVI